MIAKTKKDYKTILQSCKFYEIITYLFNLPIEPSTWDALSKKTTEAKPFGLDVASLKPGSPSQAISTFLKFAFQMDSIVLNLFTG